MLYGSKIVCLNMNEMWSFYCREKESYDESNWTKLIFCSSIVWWNQLVK